MLAHLPPCLLRVRPLDPRNSTFSYEAPAAPPRGADLQREVSEAPRERSFSISADFRPGSPPSAGGALRWFLTWGGGDLGLSGLRAATASINGLGPPPRRGASRVRGTNLEMDAWGRFALPLTPRWESRVDAVFPPPFWRMRIFQLFRVWGRFGVVGREIGVPEQSAAPGGAGFEGTVDGKRGGSLCLVCGPL